MSLLPLKNRGTTTTKKSRFLKRKYYFNKDFSDRELIVLYLFLLLSKTGKRSLQYKLHQEILSSRGKSKTVFTYSWNQTQKSFEVRSRKSASVQEVSDQLMSPTAFDYVNEQKLLTMNHRNQDAICGTLMPFSPLMWHHTKALFLGGSAIKGREVEPDHRSFPPLSNFPSQKYNTPLFSNTIKFC